MGVGVGVVQRAEDRAEAAGRGQTAERERIKGRIKGQRAKVRERENKG
jgi:hypothetical protein